MNNRYARTNMPWEHAIKEFGNTYTCIERDERGLVCNGEMKVVKYKNMWIFDIGYDHTLDILDRPTHDIKGQMNHVESYPAYVKDDLTLQTFEDTDPGSNQFAYGPVTTLERHGKFNAVFLNPFVLGGSDTTPIVFAVPRLHVKHISALYTVNPCGSADPDNDTFVPNSKVCGEHGFHFILTEMTPCGLPVQHQPMVIMQSKESLPEENTYTVVLTANNLVRLEIVNDLSTRLSFSISPMMYKTYRYTPSLTHVNVGERKTVMIASADYIMEGMRFERYSDEVCDKTKHYFLISNIKMFDRFSSIYSSSRQPGYPN